jgi:hypothetical protein
MTGHRARFRSVGRRRIARTALVLAVAAVAAVVLMTTPAGAIAPNQVEITLLRNGPPGSEPTTWSATGAFTGSGTWTLDRFVCGACPAPITGSFHFYTTLTATDGDTIDLDLSAVFNQSVDQTYWQIIGGTGAYADVRGHGSYTVSIDDDGVRHIVCTGEVKT